MRSGRPWNRACKSSRISPLVSRPIFRKAMGGGTTEGGVPPFVGSFCIVRGRFHRSSLPLGIPACPNISPRRPRVEYCFCWHGFSLGSICFLWMFSLFLLSNWMFPSAPTRGCYPVAVPERTCSAGACLREGVSRCTGGTAPEPLASCCSNGVPIGANLWTPHRSPLPCRARRRRPQGLGLSLCRQLFVCVGASRRTYKLAIVCVRWSPFGARSSWYARPPLPDLAGMLALPAAHARWSRLDVHTELAIVCLRGSVSTYIHNWQLFVYVGASRL